MTPSRVDEAKTTRARQVADVHLRQELVADGKRCTLDVDAAAFNRAQRMNGSDTGGGHGTRKSEV